MAGHMYAGGLPVCGFAGSLKDDFSSGHGQYSVG
jgi:hypothetical protein